ncbi:MAG: EAL domain-containing protein [Lachnospiraceae bacterium]|nr:EAL domain-containing protein [Lachnospiraceae bacterium]
MSKLDALNRAFEKAFAHTATKETLEDLLACIGEELSCDRIAIFEVSSDRVLDNTYEWVREGEAEERDLLQNIPAESFDTWEVRLKNDEIIRIRDLKEIRATDPDVYDLFFPQHVRSAVVSRLAFHGRDLGFFILENPGEGTLEEASVLLPGMRYILSSLVYSDHLVRRLERIGYTDSLTGAGNRASLQAALEQLDRNASFGVIYCDVIGWSENVGAPHHFREEQEYLRAGTILGNVFDVGSVFRVATEEFLVLATGDGEGEFDEKCARLAGLFREEGLLIAVSKLYCEDGDPDFEGAIRRTRLSVYEEKRRLLEDRKKRRALTEELGDDRPDRAEINLYRGDEFFQKAEQLLGQIFDEPVLTAVLDINYFKLYNDIFGRRAGNLLLENIASQIRNQARLRRGIAGYLGGDNFCLILPLKKDGEEQVQEVIDEILAGLEYADGFNPVIGFYLSTDRDESMISMFDRAQTALEEIQGDYFEHYRFYDAEHFQHIRDEQLLLMDVKEGLDKGEFVFYLQPQVHGRTGKIIGAEALVRWNSRGQIISPGRFVPVLEKSGYIFAVDCFVWESVVRWIRSLIDRGITPIPCSVNVSRVDFYFTDVAEHFTKLLEKYDVEPRYVGVEITESALTDNSDSILLAVQKLRKAGFRLLMDDFGSGTSSLSMLHTMNLDVLKTDVKFMSRRNSDSRAISIVEAVISMAHMIGMLVVSEGVETEQQKDSLIALGDNYVQGFYFYQPMPVEDFEKLLADPEKIGEPPKRGDEVFRNKLNLKEIIREGMVSDTLLDNIIGPAAVYRESDDHFSIVQINDQYSELTGIAIDDYETMEQFVEKFHRGGEEEVATILRSADTHPLEGAEGIVSFRRTDGRLLKLRARVFMLYTCGGHRLYLSTIQEAAGG